MPQAATRDERDLRRHWNLAPDLLFLNHGSFGACPEPILAKQRELARELERSPILFLHRQIERRLEDARESLARFLGAKGDDLAFVPNATAGVNTVLRSLEQLPAKQREVVYLRFYAEDSLEGIAAALGCPVGTVKSRLFHGLEGLRRMKAILEERKP